MSGADIERGGCDSTARTPSASLSSTCRLQDHQLVCGEHAALLTEVERSTFHGYVAAGHAAGGQDLTQRRQRPRNQTLGQNATGARDHRRGNTRHERPGGLFVMAMDRTNLPARVEADSLFRPRDGPLEYHQVVRHTRLRGVVAHEPGKLEVTDWQASGIDDQERVGELVALERICKFPGRPDDVRGRTHALNPVPV